LVISSRSPLRDDAQFFIIGLLLNFLSFPLLVRKPFVPYWSVPPRHPSSPQIRRKGFVRRPFFVIGMRDVPFYSFCVVSKTPDVRPFHSSLMFLFCVHSIPWSLFGFSFLPPSPLTLKKKPSHCRLRNSGLPVSPPHLIFREVPPCPFPLLPLSSLNFPLLSVAIF